MAIFIPAILSRDIQDVNEKFDFLKGIPGLTDIHLDVADGIFVPNKTVLPSQLPDLKGPVKVEAHMMVNGPSLYFQDLYNTGVQSVIIHYESFANIDEITTAIDNLKGLQLRVGVSINPETGIEVFDKFINKIDRCLLMSVHPGFQGSEFVPETFERLQELRKKHRDAIIEVDGGVTLDNFEMLIAHGANRLVAGSAIWKSEDPKQTIEKFLAK